MSGTELQEQLIALADVPALVLATGSPSAAAEQGTVLTLHGLTASKEVQRTEAVGACGFSMGASSVRR